MYIEGTRIENLEGNTFHYLTVLNKWRRNENNKRIEWLCQCKCGKQVWVLAKYLKNGDTKSCGCYNLEKIHERSFKDLSNKRFGRLLVSSEWKKEEKDLNRILWKCHCDCGKDIWVLAASLQSGNTKSCGCLHHDLVVKNNMEKFVDLTNLRFGKLVAIKPTTERKNGLVVWQCLCDCGNTTYVTSNNLCKRNGVKSCGCLLSKGESLIEKYLTDLNLKFKKQYSFPDLKSSKNLRFDFAIFQNNELLCLIEYQGIQHYDKNNYYWSEEGEERDRLKKEYCFKKNIKLIEIPYWEFDKININYIKKIIGL